MRARTARRLWVSVSRGSQRIQFLLNRFLAKVILGRLKCFLVALLCRIRTFKLNKNISQFNAPIVETGCVFVLHQNSCVGPGGPECLRLVIGLYPVLCRCHPTIQYAAAGCFCGVLFIFPCLDTKPIKRGQVWRPFPDSALAASIRFAPRSLWLVDDTEQPGHRDARKSWRR